MGDANSCDARRIRVGTIKAKHSNYGNTSGLIKKFEPHRVICCDEMRNYAYRISAAVYIEKKLKTVIVHNCYQICPNRYQNWKMNSFSAR